MMAMTDAEFWAELERQQAEQVSWDRFAAVVADWNGTTKVVATAPAKGTVYGIDGPTAKYGNQGKVYEANGIGLLPETCLYWCVPGGPWIPFPERMPAAKMVRAEKALKWAEKVAKRKRRRKFIERKAFEEARPVEVVDAEHKEDDDADEPST